MHNQQISQPTVMYLKYECSVLAITHMHLYNYTIHHYIAMKCPLTSSPGHSQFFSVQHCKAGSGLEMRLAINVILIPQTDANFLQPHQTSKRKSYNVYD